VTTADVTVIGGGIVGLATARELLLRHPAMRVLVLEKEPRLASHQTGHNSGVIHSGIYYRPGSAKARLCVSGAEQMKRYCSARGVPFEVCGKVVVAVVEGDLPKLEELHRRGVANGVPGVELVGAERLREIEPHAAGIRALHVPGSAIVDFAGVAEKLAEDARAAGAEILTNAPVTRIAADGEALVLNTSAAEVRTRHVIACAGLHSDRVARMEGADPGTRIVPFRGEYYDLVPDARRLVRGLIYPVPDPRFPFLGVHFTRTIHGGVEAGPNAVVALKREGYRKRDVSLRDVGEVLGYRGFWRLAARYWRTGLEEIGRSFSTRAFVRALARLVPEIRLEDVVPAAAGVRAQALAPSGELVDDFWIVERARALHVLNAPSPAATASLAIAAEIATRAEKRFRLD
jgi:L-2-hydroxyglutarate oxidase LhgO